MRTKKGKQFPKTGSMFPRGSSSNGGAPLLARLVAEALREHFATKPHAVKTVMAWTEASDRTVKNWFAGTHEPNGTNLIALARHSDHVFQLFLSLTRHDPDITDQLIGLRTQLGATILMIDGLLSSQD
ncbi:hypothetical protein NS226_08385 [Aureimonas ureilytica]|uniref:XRE family transcriptional regulator n=1 Tax=Aureimonas ureilytica TaxID=401562 RepID=A0A175R9T4_9HYPH|nr:hypothetical protein [Aureimonas ureilytica]KTQ96068.1 hypothetical protein NS226_08385 [Aureimonas ureilytica]